mmetsp:Transcript_49665/g.121255  ORF Transcript_49665/g.121255 Transcript_49665/m.121255 type:complete len:462 (+) Transcript_49665:66-1451(+)|eukprot:CAMPEP_0206244012 /NCGR_PEP_ID=MMETSP0047_2-20121206/17919_1 /ASSEMBLY_ACC=CAM_ASM_000192 /TAXON_ID=195065 /ORGANISM="Chroomonas mesostigmatica_cf, Strain CCMP1168" /LENGTH=461 /DNA_ID=CAMNT_0053669181 /DNA_START=59 /DNA_END=1444 /DNA_ORIENTATION=+
MKAAAGALLALLCLAASVVAHRPLSFTTKCGEQHGYPADALEVPNIGVSWAVNRVFTCEAPVFYLTFDIPEDDYPLYVGVGSPMIERLKNARANIVVFGTDMPRGDIDDNGSPSGIPVTLPLDEIAKALGVETSEVGWQSYSSAEDLSTCDFIESGPMKPESTIKEGRCTFYERFGRTDSYLTLDKILTVPQKGKHTLAVWLTDADTAGLTTGKAWVAVSDWDMVEDFRTVYNMDLTNSCGCSAVDFYEAMEGSMEEPPVYLCADTGGKDEGTTCKRSRSVMLSGVLSGAPDGKGDGYVPIKAGADLGMTFTGTCEVWSLPCSGETVLRNTFGAKFADGRPAMAMYMGHAHFGDCADPGEHWMRDMNPVGAVETNEMWQMLKPMESSLTTAYPDRPINEETKPLSFVWHNMSTNPMQQLACCEYNWSNIELAPCGSSATSTLSGLALAAALATLSALFVGL